MNLKQKVMCLALSVTTLTAQQQQRFDHQVRNLFFSGFAGNQAAMEEALKLTGATLAENPKHAEAMVWQGSGIYYQAGVAARKGEMQESLRLLNQGLSMMQQAVDMEPDNVAVRAPRGSALLTASRVMPAEMARPQLLAGLSDYVRIYDMQKQSGVLERLGTHPKGELLFGLAEAYSRLGDTAKAESFFQMIKDTLPNSAYARRAQTWLETKSLPLNQTGCIGCHVSGK
jgi:tetratricopeptide (TPR) repeat protein